MILNYRPLFHGIGAIVVIVGIVFYSINNRSNNEKAAADHLMSGAGRVATENDGNQRVLSGDSLAKTGPVENNAGKIGGQSKKRARPVRQFVANPDKMQSIGSPNGNHRHIDVNEARTDQHGISPATKSRVAAADVVAQYHESFFQKYNIDGPMKDLVLSTLAEQVQKVGNPAGKDLTVDERLQRAQERCQSVEDALLPALGDEKYAQLVHYEETLPQRQLANLVAEQCQNDGVSMTATDTEALIEILYANRVTYFRQDLIMGYQPLVDKVVSSVKAKTPSVINDAQKTLSPQQADELGRVLDKISHW